MKSQKSLERRLAEKVARANRVSLIMVNRFAMQLVFSGLVRTRLEGLQYLASLWFGDDSEVA